MFLEDNSLSAWQSLIDRLLASPAYGEQWGRHWLDVARYPLFQLKDEPEGERRSSCGLRGIIA